MKRRLRISNFRKPVQLNTRESVDGSPLDEFSSGKVWRPLILKDAPFFTFGILVFASLKSSWIYGEGSFDWSLGYRTQYFGWYDVIIFSCCIAQLISLRPKGLLKIATFLFLFFGTILLPNLLNNLPSEALFESTVLFGRFSVIFATTILCCKNDGGELVRELVFLLVPLLFLSAVFVSFANIGLGTRMYGAGMTVGSYSQFIVAAFTIALFRGRRILAMIFTAVLAPTLSRTSIIVWIVVAVSYTWMIKRRNRMGVVFALAVLAMSLAAYSFFRGEDIKEYFRNQTTVENVSSLNGRTGLWVYALELIQSGRVPVYGLGSGVGYTQLEFARIGGTDKRIASFHNIWLEYSIDLGFFSFPIFVALIFGIVYKAKKKEWESVFLLFVFVVSQTIDYTFYGPKEVVLWSLVLGYAIGSSLHYDNVPCDRRDRKIHL